MSSILVRKYCQPVLDAAGYPTFFATVSDSYAHPLKIYTTCGKSFVEIHGVRFSKSKPSVAESEYSAELLEQWLARHKEDFEEYVDAYVAYNELKELDSEMEKDGVTYEIDRSAVRIIQTLENNHKIAHRITPEGVFDIEWTNSLPLDSYAAMIKLPAKMRDTALKFYNSYKVYWDARKRFNDIHEKIHTCAI